MGVPNNRMPTPNRDCMNASTIISKISIIDRSIWRLKSWTYNSYFSEHVNQRWRTPSSERSQLKVCWTPAQRNLALWLALFHCPAVSPNGTPLADIALLYIGSSDSINCEYTFIGNTLILDLKLLSFLTQTGWTCHEAWTDETAPSQQSIWYLLENDASRLHLLYNFEIALQT